VTEFFFTRRRKAAENNFQNLFSQVCLRGFAPLREFFSSNLFTTIFRRLNTGE
jgi:hypothetical protein